MSPPVDPLEVQFHLVHDCVRSCVFADHIARLMPAAEAWPSICDMCVSDAIMSWNAIFGTTSQETHWKKLVESRPLPAPSTLRPFGKDLIVEYLKTTPDEWEKYHASMVDFRNTRLAHFNHAVVRERIPDITWALHSAFIYREWLLSLLRAHQSAGRKISITKTTGEEMMEIFKRQIAEICS